MCKKTMVVNKRKMPKLRASNLRYQNQVQKFEYVEIVITYDGKGDAEIRNHVRTEKDVLTNREDF